MSTPYLVAFVCYGLSALLSMIFGTIYLVRFTFMPYHQEAVGKSWQDLDQNLQALVLGLMRVAGGGLLTTGISIAILLFIPFRLEETWSIYAIPVIGFSSGIPALYATILIRSSTQAHTPVAASSAGIVLILIGFILSTI